MPFNPFVMPDPFGQQNLLPPQPSYQQQPPIPPLSPQDESSLLEKIGAAGLGGLSFIGGILNKPGRVIRGLLGGQPREALNLIPFSDALGLTDHSQQVTGNQLLGNPEDTSFFSPEGLAGFGVDVLTDPLTYLSSLGSALNKLGQAAKKAGVLPETVAGRLAGVTGDAAEALAQATGKTAAEVAGQRLGGHLGLGLPFSGEQAVFDLRPVGNALSTALDYLPGGSTLKSVGGTVGNALGDFYTRTIPPLFEGAVMGRKTAKGQEVARRISADTPEAIAQAANKTIPLAEKAAKYGLTDEASSMLLRTMGETGEIPSAALPAGYKSIAEEIAAEQAAGRWPAGPLSTGEIDPKKLMPREGLTLENAGDFLEGSGDIRQLYNHIAANGEVPPIVVARGIDGRMQILDGEHRAMVARIAGKPIKAIFIDKELPSAASRIIGPMKAELENMLGLKREMGLPAPELRQAPIPAGLGEGNLLEYLPRERAPKEAKSLREWWGSKTPQPEPEWARKDWLDGLTSEAVTKMAREDLGQSVDEIQRNIGQRYLGLDKAAAEVENVKQLIHDDMAIHQGVVTNENLLKQLADAEARQAALTSQARELAKVKANGSMPEFTNHVVKDYFARLAKDHVNLLKAKNIYQGLAESVVPASENTVPLMDAIKGLWKPTDTAGESILENATRNAAGLLTGDVVGHTPPQGAMVQMTEALKKAGVEIRSPAELANLHVPADVAADLQGLTRMHSINGMEQFTKVWDSLTNLTKAYQTILWPANQVRNQAQAVFQNMVGNAAYEGYGPLNPMRYIQPWLDARKWQMGQTIDGLAQRIPGLGATDEAATKALQREVIAYDVTRQGAKLHQEGLASSLTKGREPAEMQLERFLPGRPQQTPLEAVKNAGWGEKGSLNLAGVHGAFGFESDTFAPIRAGRQVASSLDDLNRVSAYLAKRSQGFEPLQALKEVDRLHYNFGNVSQFEKSFMRRIVPFYGWMRQNVPAVVSEIATNPGGKLATAVKASGEMKGEKPGFIPPYIGEGVAVPIGGEQDGQQRYLTRLGLGFEDLGQLLGPGGPVGTLNPLIKFPIEQMTGKQLFTGRDLRDLDSMSNRVLGTPLPTAENLLMNSPAGRLLSTGRTLTDPRKSWGDVGLNLLTGARVSDVDVEGARRRAVRDYISENLHGPGISRFETLSVKPGQFPLLSPAEQALYQLYRSQEQKARQRGR